MAVLAVRSHFSSILTKNSAFFDNFNLRRSLKEWFFFHFCVLSHHHPTGPGLRGKIAQEKSAFFTLNHSVFNKSKGKIDFLGQFWIIEGCL
jgi:hypothetical protein